MGRVWIFPNRRGVACDRNCSVTEGWPNMALLICYTSDSRAYVEWLERGRPADEPSDVPFWLPEKTLKGDRYLLYVGGQDQTYVGWGRIESNWRSGTKKWAGRDIIQANDRIFEQPIPGSDVFAATVWRAARGKPLSQTDRAVEGILTESRSRSRNAGLRLAALQRAGGVCEGCGVNFAKKHGELGRHCLVVHHKRQFKDTDQPVETKLPDLAVVCANCHMMIHVNRDRALTLAQLKKRIGRN